MVTLWYQRQSPLRLRLVNYELDKLLLKSLLSNISFNQDAKIYFGKMFKKFTKISSFSYYRRFCVKTGFTRSVFQRFKMVRHHCKYYAANGYLAGLRRASF